MLKRPARVAPGGLLRNWDGKHDEVFLSVNTKVLDPNGTVLDNLNSESELMGDTWRLPGRVQVGSASDRGGIISGDKFPWDKPMIRQNGLNTTVRVPPFVIWEGELPASRMVFLTPTIWEWDPGAGAWDGWLAWQKQTDEKYGQRAKKMLAKALSVPVPPLRKPGSAWTELPRPPAAGAVRTAATFAETSRALRSSCRSTSTPSPGPASSRPPPRPRAARELPKSTPGSPPASSTSSPASPPPALTNSSRPRAGTTVSPATTRPEAQPMRADNSSHLIEAAQQRRLQCIARVRTALDDMERGGGPVTIAGVAARAKVSRTFLYDGAQAPLLERLRTVANAQPGSGRPALPENQRVSTKSHEAIVRTLRAANQKLRQDNDRLANELAVALGQLRDLRRGLPGTPRG